MITILAISDLVWNRIVTVFCFSVILAAMALNDRNYKKWKSKFARESITEYDRINKIVHSAPFALNSYIVLNVDGKIVGANERVQKMFGWKEQELLGSEINKIIAPQCLVGFENYKKDSTKNEETIEMEGLTKAGEKLNLEIFIGKWSDDLTWYYTVIIRDISHRKRNEQTVSAAYAEINYLRELYHEGEKIGQVAFWKLDVRTGVLWPLSPNFYHLFGIKGMELKVENLIKRVYEEDKIFVAERMNMAKQNKTGYDIQYRMHGLDDYLNTIHSVASAFKNKQGELTHYIGMARLVKKEKEKWA